MYSKKIKTINIVFLTMNGSVVEQASKFTSTQTQDRQLWSFVSVNVDGFEMTRIQAKSQENSGMYLASSSVMDSYGYDAEYATYFAVSATGCNSTVSSMVVITEAN